MKCLTELIHDHYRIDQPMPDLMNLRVGDVIRYSDFSTWTIADVRHQSYVLLTERAGDLKYGWIQKHQSLTENKYVYKGNVFVSAEDVEAAKTQKIGIAV